MIHEDSIVSRAPTPPCMPRVGLSPASVQTPGALSHLSTLGIPTIFYSAPAQLQTCLQYSWNKCQRYQTKFSTLAHFPAFLQHLPDSRQNYVAAFRPHTLDPAPGLEEICIHPDRARQSKLQIPALKGRRPQNNGTCTKTQRYTRMFAAYFSRTIYIFWSLVLLCVPT